MNWVRWWFMKAGNDGRRPSGTQFRQGVWHIIKSQEGEGKDITAKTLCGRESNLWPKTSADPAGDEPRCKLCAKKAQAKV